MTDRRENPGDDTTTLFARLAAGDETAVDALLERNLPWIRGEVHRRLGGVARREGDTGDVVQEIAVRVLRSRPRIRLHDRDEFRAYLALVICNTLRSIAGRHLARKRDAFRERRLSTRTLLGGAAPAGGATAPDEEAGDRELERLIASAIDLLEPADSDVIWLRIHEDLAFAAVGERLGVGEDAARMRFQRALPKLRRAVELLRADRVGELIPR